VGSGLLAEGPGDAEPVQPAAGRGDQRLGEALAPVDHRQTAHLRVREDAPDPLCDALGDILGRETLLEARGGDQNVQCHRSTSLFRVRRGTGAAPCCAGGCFDGLQIRADAAPGSGRLPVERVWRSSPSQGQITAAKSASSSRCSGISQALRRSRSPGAKVVPSNSANMARGLALTGRVRQ